MKQAALPYMLTGNVEDRIVNRMIRQQKFNDALEANDKFQRFKERDYHMLLQIPGKEDILNQKLSTIINTKFSYITYENPELTGTEIEYDVVEIADELVVFLDYF